MNPSYVRIRVPYEAAAQRMLQWLGKPLLEPPRQADSLEAVELACDDEGNWRGSALLAYESGAWTVFEDLSGALSCVPASRWLELAGSDGLVFAGYNDAILYAELVVIEKGRVLREFLYAADSPEDNFDRGKLESEATDPIVSWTDVAAMVDEDEIVSSEKGWLWLF